ncbi:hypothetical protein F5H01DRAFT_412702 [Linnemannia elongata]|nr:hypothetical protein F5H01DRAFT_412702 [Linnemannia elongata]
MPRLTFSSFTSFFHSSSIISHLTTRHPTLPRSLFNTNSIRHLPPPPPLLLIHLRSFTKMTFDDSQDGQVKIHSREKPQQQQQKTQAELEKEIWQEAHRQACEGNRKKYIDPKTGYSVMTELLHKRRGYCCGNACRHCPYNNENVGVSPEVKRANIARGKQQRKEIEAIEGKPVWADDDDNDYSD